MKSRRFGFGAIFSVFVIAALLAAEFAFFPIRQAEAAGTTYYVDSAGGNDSNSGTSESASWKTLAKVNGIVFQPGDRIYLKSGSSWNENLLPQGSGSSGNPIVIDAYGTGSKPLINGTGGEYAVLLHNQEYWTIQNLEITNRGPSEPESKRSGVEIRTSGNHGVLHDIKLIGLDVHDVDGISSRRFDNYPKWETAGIVVRITDTAGAADSSRLDGLLIENCRIYDLTTAGITFFGTVFTPNRWHTNVMIRNNFVSNTGSDGIVGGFSVAPVYEYNTVYDAGANGKGYGNNAGMWETNTVSPVFQYNEVARTRMDSGDAMAFDVDWGTSGTPLIQYNYTHHNAGGIFMEMNNANYTGYEKTVFRYNISQNDEDGYVYITRRGNVHFYNNTIFNAGGDIEISDWYYNLPGNVIANNIFVAKNGYYDTGSYDNNLYFGHNGPNSDTHKVTGDPKFAEPNGAGDGRSTADAYKLLAGSPALQAGKIIADNGGKDFWGNVVSATYAPHIGAYNGPAVPVGGSLNLVANPGFETGTAAPWTGTNNGITEAPGTVRSGYYAGVINRRFGELSSPTITNLSPNTEYIFSVYTKVDSGSVDIYVVDFGDYRWQNVTSHEWTKVSLPFKTGAANTTATIKTFRLMGLYGNAYFDNFSIVPAASVPNNKPIANNLAFTTPANTTLSGMLSASDADGDPLFYKIVTNGVKGTARVTDTATGRFGYVPLPGASGSDTFTFQVHDGKGESNIATVTINIVPPSGILVTGVQLDTSDVVLNRHSNQTHKLEAAVQPAGSSNKKVTWTSSAPNIAAVDNDGVVSAVGEGEATITVTTEDGGFQDHAQIVVDLSGPVINPPVTMAVYQSDAANIRFEISDDLSGVDDTTFLLDGAVTTNPIVIAPLALPVGDHPVQVSATDAAGNTTTMDYVLRIMIDADHLDEVLNAGAGKGWITNQGTLQSLLSRADNLQRDQADRNKMLQALNSLENHIQAQAGKHIDAAFADLLLDDIAYLKNE